MEEALIKKIESAIRGIRLGTKEPKDVAAEASHSFARLKTLNPMMAEDLLERYKNVVNDWKRKNPSK